MADRNIGADWEVEDSYWKSNYRTRPYASSYDYEYFRPGYRYGYESARRYSGRTWDEAENDLRNDWNNYQYRGQSTWEQVKVAVRDAWDRVMGRPVGTR